MALGELKNGIGPDAYAIYQQVLAAVVERDHPVGSLYISENPTSPAELYGGTWERIENRFIMGASDTYPAGTTLEAGLPNIKGSFEARPHMSGNEFVGGSITGGDGKLFAHSIKTSNNINNSMTETGNAYKSDVVFFNASASNSIYGASNTVQPPAYFTYTWLRTD